MLTEFKFVVNYSQVLHCCYLFRGLLFKYTLISLLSFLFLLDKIVISDLSSLKFILFLDQAAILLISIFETFSAALMDSFLTTSIKLSAKATALFLSENCMFKRQLYKIFQYPGPQQDPYGDPFVTALQMLALLMKELLTVD